MGRKRKQVIEVIDVELKEKERKFDILMKYKDIMSKQTRSVVPQAVGAEIWKMWQEYTGRTDRWRGCGACLAGKIKFFNKELKAIEQTIEENTKASEELEINDVLNDELSK